MPKEVDPRLQQVEERRRRPNGLGQNLDPLHMGEINRAINARGVPNLGPESTKVPGSRGGVDIKKLEENAGHPIEPTTELGRNTGLRGGPMGHQ